MADSQPKAPRRAAHFAQGGAGAPKAAAGGQVQAPSSPYARQATDPWHHGRPWVVPAAALALVAVAYLAGVALFSFRFLPNTTLNGNDVALRTASEVAASIDSSVSSYSATISGHDVNARFTAADIDLTSSAEAGTRAALSSQGAWAWPLHIASAHSLTTQPDLSYDADKLTALVQSAVDRSGSGTVAEAEIAYNAETHQFEFTDKGVAESVDVSLVVGRADEAIRSLDPEVTVDDGCMVADEGLTASVAAANAYVDSPITLTLGGTTAYELGADQIAQWVVIGEGLSVSLDTEAISAWCHGELSQLLDSVGTSRTFTNPKGETITTNARGSYGWSIDGEGTADLIEERLGTGSPSTVDIPTLSSAAIVNPGGQDWGNRYVEVDISDQHAIFYGDDGSVIWEADVVTGLPNGERDTPQGVFYITSRYTDTTLRGPKKEDGSYEWESHVDFWMGVVGNAVGFHNAPWRSSFGGSIYRWNGSHGCINLSYEKGQALYDLVEVGDVVVIHE